jgi:hypothetical protein
MILPLILGAAVACQPATMELTEEQKAEVEDVVKELAAKYSEAWMSDRDIDGYMHYASDWAGTPWGCCETLEDLRSYATRFWNRWDWESHELGEMSVLVLGPDAAAVTFTAVAVRVDSAGVRSEVTNEIANLWVREAGQWKLLIGKNHVHPTGT